MPRTTPASDIADQVRNEAYEEPERRIKRVFKEEDLVPSGSTMLNCACSDTPYGAFILGGFVTIPGASSAGKTVLALSTLAECSRLPRFDEYELIHDDTEERMSFDLDYLFGKRFAKRLAKPPLGVSKTVQMFKANVLTLLQDSKIHKPQQSIYVLDSIDSLTSDEELEKEFKKALAMAKSAEAVDKIAGSYGTEKAKILGETLRMINNELEKSRSLIIMLQQRRQKIGFTGFGEKFCTAGGEAPEFYSNHRIWLSKVSDIKEKGQQIGTETECKLKKNSLTGKRRECTFDIYDDYGIDDLNSCIDFLLKENFWKKEGHSILPVGLFEGKWNRAELIKRVENEALERELQGIVGEAWMEIENSLKLGRKPKYA